MKRSIRLKTFLTVVLVVFLVFLLGLSFSVTFVARFYIVNKRESMVEIYEKLGEIYSYEESGEESSGIAENYQRITLLCEENSISLLIISPSLETEFSYGYNEILSKRLLTLLLEGDDSAQIISETDNYTLQNTTDEATGTSYIEIWGFLGGGEIFIARSSSSGISQISEVFLTFFMIVFIVMFLVLVTVAMFAFKPYTDALRRLVNVAQRVNEGEFEPLPDEKEEKKKRSRNDEIGILGTNIYEMSHKLEKTIAELKSSNLNLENELSKKIEQEENRKKYMSDVSHELKTPIAIISGYAEGLKEGISEDPEDREYYCNVIIDEANKMNTMVKKLATLNQLEFGKSEVSLQRFDVVQVINGFLNKMALVIEENGANIYFDSSECVCVWSDEFLFEEAFMNYFNNAINHLDENKIIRIIAGRADKENVRVTVFNSGEHIPEDETEKIWGKFYKVDKARTREYGGSGLGLSIVKAIADSLGRECGVYNTEGGVAFWINLEAASPYSEECANAAKNKSGDDEVLDGTYEPAAHIGSLTGLPRWVATAIGERIGGYGKKEEKDASDK